MKKVVLYAAAILTTYPVVAHADTACWAIGYRTDESVGNGNYPKYVYYSSTFADTSRSSAEAKFTEYVRTRYGRTYQGVPVLNIYKSRCTSNDPENIAEDGERSARGVGGTLSVRVINTGWRP